MSLCSVKWCPVNLTLIILFNIDHLFSHCRKWLNRSIWLIAWTLVGTTTPGLSGPGSNDNGHREDLRISQTSKTYAYTGHSFGWIIPLWNAAVGDFHSINLERGHYVWDGLTFKNNKTTFGKE